MDAVDLGGHLAARARKYQKTMAEHDRARDELHAAVLEAWRAGWRPATISELTGLTTSYLRKLARDAQLPAAPTGRRSRAERGK